MPGFSQFRPQQVSGAGPPHRWPFAAWARAPPTRLRRRPERRRPCLLSRSLPAAKNTVVRGLENVEAPEGGEALFECQLSRPEVAAHSWLLDDEPVHTSEDTEVVYFENGLRHLLLLKNLRPQDSCRVTFLAGEVVTSAFLTVRG